MNSITKLAIKEAFGTNPRDAIAVKVSLVLCIHHPDEGYYIPNNEAPTPSESSEKIIHLKQYRYGDRVAMIGYCYMCEKTYYMD